MLCNNMLYWPHLVTWPVCIAGPVQYVWCSPLCLWLTEIMLEPWREILAQLGVNIRDRHCKSQNVAGICAHTSLCLSVRKDRCKAYTSKGRWCHCYINVRAVCQWESVSLARPADWPAESWIASIQPEVLETMPMYMFVYDYIHQTEQISCEFLSEEKWNGQRLCTCAWR